MGGCTIDLRGADIGAEGAVIDAFSFWGGIKILVPETWVVTNKVLPLLGGSEDSSRAIAGATRQLLVRGSAIMGGVEIANHDDDNDHHHDRSSINNVNDPGRANNCRSGTGRDARRLA